MKKVIERMNAGVVDLQQQRKSGKEGGRLKWLSRKVSGTSNQDSKKSAGDLGDNEEVEGMRVDFYLVVFLKFIASIVPTIEVDSTTAF